MDGNPLIFLFSFLCFGLLAFGPFLGVYIVYKVCKAWSEADEAEPEPLPEWTPRRSFRRCDPPGLRR